MTDENWPTPTRKESRGVFPAHEDRPGPGVPLPWAEALRIARKRLADWLDEHPELVPGAYGV
jgi:hypothetical protein